MSDSSKQPQPIRFDLRVPVRYRVSNERIWHEGHTINIGRAGVLFEGDAQYPPGTRLELSISLPLAVGGRTSARIACHATVVRTVENQLMDVRISGTRIRRNIPETPAA